jgi:hypothetical protein
MPDVTHILGQLAADTMNFTKQGSQTMFGGVLVTRWVPRAGQRKVKAGEFWPEILAYPSKLQISLGESRLNVDVRGTVVTPIVDGVGIIGPIDPFRGILADWERKRHVVVVDAVREKDKWFRENPIYQTSNPNKKKATKSKLDPRQLEAG